ncbi:MAG: hypothetical protein ACTSXU_15010, partial [Promethearchaeota archaeon]
RVSRMNFMMLNITDTPSSNSLFKAGINVILVPSEIYTDLIFSGRFLSCRSSSFINNIFLPLKGSIFGVMQGNEGFFSSMLDLVRCELVF